jgi:hypothetical protein
MPCCSGGGTPEDSARRAGPALTRDIENLHDSIYEIKDMLKDKLDELTARYCRLSNAVVDKYGVDAIVELVPHDDLTYLQAHEEEDINRVVNYLKRFDQAEHKIMYRLLKSVAKNKGWDNANS